MNKNRSIILSSILSFSILFSYGTSFALDGDHSRNSASQRNIMAEKEKNVVTSSQKTNYENLGLKFEKESRENENYPMYLGEESNSKKVNPLLSDNITTAENKDLFVFEGAETFLDDMDSTVDVYSHSNLIDENSTIEFRHEDGTALVFKSTKENSRNGNFYFRVKTTKNGKWFLSSFNKEPVKNDSLNFTTYKDFDEFNEINNKEVINLIAGTNRAKRFKRSLRYIERYSGSNRFNTATSISKNNYSTANNVIVVNGRAPSDALAATALAKQLNAPILYTESDFLESNTKSEITRLNARNAYIIGGISSVSNTVYNEIRNTGNISNIERISGSNRANTALALAKKTMQYSKGKSAIIVDGKSEMDCLAVSAISGEYANPLIYVVDGRLDSNSRNFVKNNFSKVFTMSGDKNISSSIVNDLKSFSTVYQKYGNSSYDLSIKLSNDSMFYTNINNVYITANTPDGIPGSVLAAKKGVPLILYDNSNKNAIVNYVNNKSIDNVFLLGGKNSIPQAFEDELRGSGNSNPDLDSRRQAVINLAKKQIGKPYVYGATGPSSFDCSGLVYYVYKNSVGITPPRVSKAQGSWGQATTRANLKPGDIVFWNSPYNHVAIYVGNNQVIHAPQPGETVRQQTIWGNPVSYRTFLK